MDADRFDGLARRLGRAGTRRAVIATVLSAITAVVVRSGKPATAQTAVPLGGACASHEQCIPVDPARGWATCRANGIDADGAANCCLVAGSWCSTDSECCDGYLCEMPGVCGPVAASGLPAGRYCASVDLCSASEFYGGWPVYCADNGVWADGPTNCCRPAGSPCNDFGDCCWSLQCNYGRCG